MLTEVTSREFTNGKVYMLRTYDDFPLETTDTFLPFYTKNCINEHTNELKSDEIGDRTGRWMVGVSCMSGCPVHCEFCATGKLKKWRNLSAEEIYEQVKFILNKNTEINIKDCKEFKINYTRMGEPFLNIDNVRKAIELVNNDERLKGVRVHHYISTIGIKGSDFSWIKDNITLQLSLHSLDEERRHKLIPINNLMSIAELGKIRTESDLKTTLNMTLVDTADFDINKLKEYFDPEYFFIKLSPINENEVSKSNNMGSGIIKSQNIL
jgi:23S rRNA (adenine2503-C2)-methyltransferase